MPETMIDNDPELGKLLEKVRAGDAAARDELIAKIYPELRRVARMLMAGERKTHTLGQTGSALVSMYWMKLRASSGNSFEGVQDLDHLLRLSIRNMRQILVDYSRRYGGKRGDAGQAASIDDVVVKAAQEPLLRADLLDLDGALVALEKESPEHAEALEYKYFSGLTIAEAAAALKIAEITYRRRCDYAEALLKKRLLSSAQSAGENPAS